MNAKHLVAAALAGQPVPRPPVGPLAVHFCAGPAGYSLSEYTTIAAALADSVIRYYERFRPDIVVVSADTWVSAEAMGARVGAVSDHQPFGALCGPQVHRAADIDRIPAPDIGAQGRYPLMLDALERVVAALGREVCVVACLDQFPFSLAAALMDINELMLRVHDDPPFVEALLERGAEYALAYGTALAAAGADLLTGGDSPAVLVGPARYEEIVLPAERALIARLKAATGRPISLHLCGDTTPLLPHLVRSGADVLEVDHAVDLATACRMAGPAIALWGNLDPVALLSRGRPDRIRQQAHAALATVRAAGHPRFLLGSGCTLAVETPPENVEALIQAAHAADEPPPAAGHVISDER
jgi:MtaA/CmuA family methyltransferase